MPDSALIGLDSPVPPNSTPVAIPGCNRSRKAALSVFSRYQPHASWHQVQNAVDMQCSAT